MPPINLATQFVIQVYCLARQAERSVDAVLFAPWADLATYYEGERTARLRNTLGSLKSLVEGQQTGSAYGSREEVLRNIASPGLIGRLAGPWVARRKRRWPFSPYELCFVAATLENFLRLLQTSKEPAREALISLRMDFWACEFLIESRCHGLSELPRAAHIEHFNQSAHVVSIKMSQLVSWPVDLTAVDSQAQSLVVQRDHHP